MRALAALALAALCAGCGVTPIVSYDKMQPDQIKELVKDKTAVGNCVTANTPYGKGIATYIAIDKNAVAAGGSVTITDQCMMTFTNGAASQPLPVIIQDSPGSFRLVVPQAPK